MNIQIKGTHKASEVAGSLAGSKHSSASSRTSQRESARKGGIVLFACGLRGDYVLRFPHLS